MATLRADVVRQAAKRLGVLAAGQDLSTEDYSALDDLWAPLCAELNARNVFTVQDLEEVGEPEFLKLADRLALEAAPTFSRTAEVMASLGLTKNGIEEDLKLIQAGTATQRVLTMEPFWGRAVGGWDWRRGT